MEHPIDKEKQPNSNALDNRSKDKRHWQTYQAAIKQHHQLISCNTPGFFSLPPEEKFHRQCQRCPLTTEICSQMPLITLPLRIHLIRSEELGCSHDLNADSVKLIVDKMNTYWKQSAIQFQLSHDNNDTTKNCNSSSNNDGVMERHIDEIVPQETRQKARHFIKHGLTRGRDGKMQNKDQRRLVFLDVILNTLNYRSNLQSYDLYFMDIIGMGSQGVCIDRSTRTVIMGERSTVSQLKTSFLI